MTLPIPHLRPQTSIRRQRFVVAGLHFITLLLLGLHLYVRRLPPTPLPIPEAEHAESAWWGLWPVTYVPSWAVIMATVLIVGWIGGWWLSEYRTRVQSTPSHESTDTHAAIWLPLALGGSILLLFLAFYAFPIVHTRWGDAYLLSKAIGWPDPALRLTHSWQAPLDVFLHSQVWLRFHAGLGWEDAIPVYRLLSPLAGLLYLVASAGVARAQWIAPTWLTFGLLASLGILQLFFGYIENYSFAAAGIMVYLWLGLRTIAGKTPLWLTASALAFTHALHPSTVVLTPSLLYCGWRSLHTTHALGNKQGRRHVLSIGLSIGLPMLLVALGVVGLMESGGHGIAALTSTDRPGGGDAQLFVPLWTITTRWEHYTMFSWLHLRDFLQQQLLVAPIVLPSLLLMLLVTPTTGRAKLKPDDTEQSRAASRFLLLASFCYVLFTWVWNPDYGGQRDWDLFSLATIPLALLLAATLTKRFSDQRYLQAGTIPLLMLQWLHLAAWIYQNTLPWQWPS